MGLLEQFFCDKITVKMTLGIQIVKNSYQRMQMINIYPLMQVFIQFWMHKVILTKKVQPFLS